MVATQRQGGAPVEGARKVANDSELREIAMAGAGFIIDLFNRWWHVASCPRIAVMTTGQPKWYAVTPAAREAFLQQRLEKHASARPVLPCATCSESCAASNVPGRGPSGSARNALAGPRLRDPCIRREGRGFEVWADDYVRNESTAASAAGLLRRLIAGQIRSLPPASGSVLVAGYGGRRWRGTDVENLLFNNMDQELELFGKPAGLGIGFEDLGFNVPDAPDGTTWQSYYRYRLVRPDAAFAAAQPEHVICRVPEVIVPDGPARLAARIWLAVRRARPLPETGVLAKLGSFLLRITVHQLKPAKSAKAVVDGVTAAMQRDDPGRVDEAVGRLSKLLDADAEELLALATAGGAPLGTRSRSGPASRGSLFTLDGLAQVRVTPDDDRCIAAQVITAGNDGPARLSVEVYSATRRTTGTRRGRRAK